MKRPFLLLFAFLVVAAGCGDATVVETTSATMSEIAGDLDDEQPTPTPPETTTPRAESVPQESTTIPEGYPGEGMTLVGVQPVPEVLQDFEFSTGWLDTEELFVAVAATPAHRRQGLMNITDLGSLSGMVFVFEQDSSTGFWMKNTLIPLDIAFFDADGRFVDGFTMEPCTTSDCPTYRPSGSYRYALEMRAGDMHPNPQQLVLGDLP